MRNLANFMTRNIAFCDLLKLILDLTLTLAFALTSNKLVHIYFSSVKSA